MRYRQHLWAKAEGITRFGAHTNTRKSIAAGRPALIPNGTRLTDQDGDAGKNFLSSTVLQVVQERIAHPQPHEMLNVDRLQRDQLSSMRMAFNLFGEASRHPESMQALARLLAPGVAADRTPMDIVFEWSPRRRSPAYTRDRTAFDVALRIGQGARTALSWVNALPTTASIVGAWKESRELRSAAYCSPASAKLRLRRGCSRT